MKGIVRSLGEMTLSFIVIIIPMLLVMGFYENWYQIIKVILVLFFVVDFIAIGTVINALQDE